MKACILNSETKVVENIIELNSLDSTSFVPYKQGIVLSSRHDGEIGWKLENEEWITNAVEITTEKLANRARYKRNNLLKRTVDNINPLRWNSFTEEQKTDWAMYRQALLDVPEQEGFPDNIVWPTKPE